MGAFEDLDWNLAAYPETITTPYRVPRSLLELYTWKGLHLHVHNCELSRKLLVVFFSFFFLKLYYITENHAYGRLELRNSDPFQRM